MFERFTNEARAAVTAAEGEARADGSRTIEAEHLMLAACGGVGLDRETVADALAAEWRLSLDAVGVGLVPPAPLRYPGRVKFGTSAKAAMARAVATATRERGDEIGTRHVALGVLGLERARVARALEAAGVDTYALWKRPSSPS